MAQRSPTSSERNLYATKESIFQGETSGLNINEFQDFMKRQSHKLSREFNKNFQGREKGSCMVFKNSENKRKNRDKKILCLDSSRVLLPRGHYIHASWVDGWNKKNQYICTQGPLAETAADFWLMAWTYNVKVIVMLSNLKDGWKCFPYWPTEHDNDHSYGEFDVICTSEKTNIDSMYMKTEFEITEKTTGEKKHMTHYMLLLWPDQGIPAKMENFLNFYTDACEEMRKEGWPDQGWPIIVHCSNGVGQSGSFITIDTCFRRLREQGRIDVKRTLQLVRSQRSGSVQSEKQYLFCHQAVLELADDLIIGKGDDVAFGDVVINAGKRNDAKLIQEQQQRQKRYQEEVQAGEGHHHDQIVHRESVLQLKVKREREIAQAREHATNSQRRTDYKPIEQQMQERHHRMEEYHELRRVHMQEARCHRINERGLAIIREVSTVSFCGSRQTGYPPHTKRDW